MKKLSIITINYNNRDGLRRTIESVVAQTTREFEYIVIDGGSTDGSIDVIKEFEDYIDYWVSEPDKGIYNAMNKGVKVANGNFCQFLNSGDWLYSNMVLEVILPFLNNDIDILVGSTIAKLENKLIIVEPPSSFSMKIFIEKGLPHQSCLIKTFLLREDPYNENLSIVSDWEFFIKAYIKKVRFKAIPYIIAFFDIPGASSNVTKLHEERMEIGKELIYPNVLEEISLIPSEMFEIMSNVKYSPRIKKIVCYIDKLLVKIYCLLKGKRYKSNDFYIKTKSPILTKKQKKSIKVIHFDF